MRITKSLVETFRSAKNVAEVWDDDVRGFGIRVSGTGLASFVVKYDFRTHKGWRARKSTIGRFGPLTVEQGRQEAKAILGARRDGRDPIGDDRKARKQAFEIEAARLEAIETERRRLDDLTLNKVWARWMEEATGRGGKARRAKTDENYRWLYAKHIGPALGARPITDLTKDDVRRFHASFKGRVIGNHVLRRLRSCLLWADGHVVKLAANPVAGTKLTAEKPRTRILATGELKAFFERLPEAGMSENCKDALMLELLIGQRSGNIGAMERREIDCDARRWTIPAA